MSRPQRPGENPAQSSETTPRGGSHRSGLILRLSHNHVDLAKSIREKNVFSRQAPTARTRRHSRCSNPSPWFSAPICSRSCLSSEPTRSSSSSSPENSPKATSPPTMLLACRPTAGFVVVSIVCAWLCALLRAKPRRPPRPLVLHPRRTHGHRRNHPQLEQPGWPHWYWISWILTWPVSCWIGLLLAKRRAAQPST